MTGAVILLAWLLVQQPTAGEQLLEAGQLDRAREAFERALKLDPGQFAALSGLGFIHYSQGRFAEARGYLERAVLARPSSFQARFLLGATLVQLNDSRAAIRELRAANRLNPAHADARKLLGVKELQTVVVRGRAKRDEAGNVIVLADGLHVRSERP